MRNIHYRLRYSCELIQLRDEEKKDAFLNKDFFADDDEDQDDEDQDDEEAEEVTEEITEPVNPPQKMKLDLPVAVDTSSNNANKVLDIYICH